jgi:hypothetical protein
MARHRTRQDAVVDQYARELRSVDELFPLDGADEVPSLESEAHSIAPARAMSTVAAHPPTAPTMRARAIA